MKISISNNLSNLPLKNPRNKKSGQAVMVATIFFLVISMIFVVGVLSPILTEAQITNNTLLSDQSYYAAESGAEDAIYRLENSIPVASTNTITVASSTATVSVLSITGGKEVDSLASDANLYRQVDIKMTNGLGVAFNYGIQAGADGIIGDGGPYSYGSVYSNGPIQGSLGVAGSATSAGAAGLIEEDSGKSIHIEGDAYAHSIKNSSVDGDAYFGCSASGSCFSNVILLGAAHPNSEDRSLIVMPVSDTLIEAWESQADGGVVNDCTGTYELAANTTGPTEIDCSVHIGAGTDITLGGPLWIKGNLTMDGGATLRFASSLGAQSLPVVVSGKIYASNGSTFYSSGTEGSYIVIVSMNSDAENNTGSDSAIYEDGGTGGNVIFYAPHGKITVTGGSDAKAVAGYAVDLKAGATINYESDVADITFPPLSSTSTSTTYTLSSWQEAQ